MTKITWKHEHTELDGSSPIEKKIEIFQARVWGSQLHVAELAINGGRNHEQTEDVSALPHSGFATLHILLSYFEMIDRYKRGDIGEAAPGKAFKRGVQMVFPDIGKSPHTVTNPFLQKLYKDARCGLYHMSMTRSGIGIWNQGEAIAYDDKQNVILINPHKLAPALTNHFADYIQRLNNPSETVLRKAFESRFDHDNS